MSHPVDTQVQVTGLVETLTRLREFDRKAYDGMTRELQDAGLGIVSASQGAIPSGNALSNWGGWNTPKQTRRGGIITQHSELRPIPFDGGAARGGVRAKAGKKFRKGNLLSTVVTVQQMNAGGAIWELAGSKDTNWGATGGSALFRQNLNKKFGAGAKNSRFWPRSLAPAFDKNIDKARELIDLVVAKYASEASSD